MSVIAVIPARGGSKRIPRKNIKEFDGKPIIAYSIEAAISSACFDRVVVSTDDEEIAVVAKKYGAEVPFVRKKSLSDDYMGTTPVIQDAITKLNDSPIAYVCCIYATAPMISHQDITKGFELLKAEEAKFAFSVTSYAFPIQRALTKDESGRISMLDKNMFGVRSQDLEECWHDAGQFYWGTKESWLRGEAIFSSDSIGVELPRHRVQDIDTPDDWAMAEYLYKK